jgi:hypothetical protein
MCVTLDACRQSTVLIQNQTTFTVVLGATNTTPVAGPIFTVEVIVNDQQWMAALTVNVFHGENCWGEKKKSNCFEKKSCEI